MNVPVRPALANSSAACGLISKDEASLERSGTLVSLGLGHPPSTSPAAWSMTGQGNDDAATMSANGGGSATNTRKKKLMTGNPPIVSARQAVASRDICLRSD